MNANENSLTKFRKVWNVKVSSRQVTRDPYTFSAIAELDFYGRAVKASGSGETRQDAVMQALATCANEIGW